MYEPTKKRDNNSGSGVIQRAGTKPNQPTTDGKYRIKLTSEREKFSYEQRLKLGIDKILPKHYEVTMVWDKKGKEYPVINGKPAGGKDFKVYGASISVGNEIKNVTMKTPIPAPEKDQYLLCIETVGYTESKDEKLFLDVKIGYYTKSQEQFRLEGAGMFKRFFKKMEHGAKDKKRTTRELGFDIDKDNYSDFLKANNKNPTHVIKALRVAKIKMFNIFKVMKTANVTFVGASIFMVLNLTDNKKTEVKIIDPDHPIISSRFGPVNQNIKVMHEHTISKGKNWADYEKKYTKSFDAGLHSFIGSFFGNFLKWEMYEIQYMDYLSNHDRSKEIPLFSFHRFPISNRLRSKSLGSI